MKKMMVNSLAYAGVGCVIATGLYISQGIALAVLAGTLTVGTYNWARSRRV